MILFLKNSLQRLKEFHFADDINNLNVLFFVYFKYLCICFTPLPASYASEVPPIHCCVLNYKYIELCICKHGYQSGACLSGVQMEHRSRFESDRPTHVGDT